MNVKYFFIKMFQILLCMSYNVLGFDFSVWERYKYYYRG